MIMDGALVPRLASFPSESSSNQERGKVEHPSRNSKKLRSKIHLYEPTEVSTMKGINFKNCGVCR
jgi:hypothetical protein